MGGGFKNLRAIELSTICTKDQECDISDPKYQNKDFTNTTPFSLKTINIQTQINTLTNASDLTSTDSLTIQIKNNGKNGKLNHLINTGNISGGIYTDNENALTKITNYGEMRGVWAWNKQNITINNTDIIKTAVGNYMSNQSSAPAHFMFENGESTLTIENYMIKIIETQNEFNNFSGYNSRTNNKNSHLIVWEHGTTKKFVAFKDENSKIILDFGGDFELGKEYLISKLVTDKSGNSLSMLNVDFDRLTTRSSLYKLTQSGDNFIISLDAPNSEIGILYKSNVRTMNNFYVMSNSMIYPRKAQNLGRTHSLLQHSPSLAEGARGWVEYPSLQADSANYLKSYESFAYRNESANRRIQRQNKRNYSRESLKTQNQRSSSLRASEYERGNPQKQRTSQNLAQNPHDYYFILTPFVNYNSFAESGRYNLSGFDYGFLTAFNARVAESNHLGTHFIMSYGSLSDKKDKDLSIKSLNLNLGLNYKLDLIYDMYLKARGDFFYFSNALDSATIKNIKPSNLGFGASVAYGKDFDFKSGGVLGIEAGLDYKALKTNEVSLNSQTYKQSLYNLIYADLGLSYAKYFGGFGINLGAGFKANLTPKLAESALIINSQTLKFTLDNDKYLGYANAGISYVLNAKSFDMEFSLAYYGNFGDRVISNAGGFEWRVMW